MFLKKIGFLLILLVILQGLTLTYDLNSNNDNHFQKKKILNPLEKNNSTINYKLYVFATKSEYTLEENVIIVILLINTATKDPIMDSVTVATPLNTQIIKLSESVNQITLGKEDFITGLNTITVTYYSQVQSVQILRRNPTTLGPTTTSIAINDILNTKPAPGVPEYVNYSVTNAAYMNFPTETNEFMQVAMTYNNANLVLATKFYETNQFIELNQVNFTIPLFLAQQQYQLQLLYSGDSFLASSTKSFNLTISPFTPIISANLSSTIINKVDTSNTSSSYLSVKIEGYLPSNLVVTFQLNGTVVFTSTITSYRQNIPIIVPYSMPTGNYSLQVNFSYSPSIQPVSLIFNVVVVQKIGLIVRTDSPFITLNQSVLFDYFCYNPITFSGVACSITMMNGSIPLFTLLTLTGHVQKILIFTNLDTSKGYTYTIVVKPLGSSSLQTNTIPYTIKFYHNTTMQVALQKNIIDKKQLLSVQADVNGKFIIKDVNDLIVASFDYTQAGSYANYFITFNNTHRGLNVFYVYFYSADSNYSNVSTTLDVYVYDAITIQSVQTNASFYQLNSFILFKGVATLGEQSDSLNNVTVSLLLSGVLVQNTTIISNNFLFIIKTPSSTGLKNYQIVIYANNNQFILTSQSYEVTVNVINNFGLIFSNRTYQAGDSIPLHVLGLENRQYSLYYKINDQVRILSNFTYTGQKTVDFKAEEYGHYIIYLEELSTGEQTYYGLNVLQNPIVTLNYGILETYTNNSILLHVNRYDGSFRIKIDTLYQNYTSYYANGTTSLTLQVFNVNPGNHSLTVLFDNQYTLQKVRTFYFIIYQKIELASIKCSNNGKSITEEDTIGMHLSFKEFTNVSLNDLAIQIITNDNTILAQANIFNSESDFQMTVIGDNLSLVLIQNNQQFVHQQIIPLNLTVYHLLTSNIKNSYSYDSAATIKIKFSYKYFPTPTSFSMRYVLSGPTSGISNTTVGQDLLIPVDSNGQYNLSILVTGLHCVNRTFQTVITVKKLFDISNTGLATLVGSILSLPVIAIGIALFKKRRTIF